MNTILSQFYQFMVRNLDIIFEFLEVRLVIEGRIVFLDVAGEAGREGGGGGMGA